MKMEELIKGKKFSIVDVRTPIEFHGGHADESINIPLNELPQRINELKALPTPLILCCASGSRSGIATQILRSHAMLEVHNGGCWADVHAVVCRNNK